MPEALGVAATALVWLVATLGAAGTGFGAVAAWTSHGHHVRLPGACTTWLDRILGAPVRPRVASKSAEAAPPAKAVENAPVQAAPKAAPPPPAAPAARAPPPVAPRNDVPDPAQGHPNDAAADPLPADAAEPELAAPPEPAVAVETTAATGEIAPTEPTAAPPAATVDIDAHLADLCAGFEVDLNVARALHASGLDDLEQMDAWRAAMRDRDSPTGIEESIWRRVCGMTSEAVRQAAADGREKRATLAVLETLWGVGPEDAAALYDAGFRDLDALREATTARLAAVGSIGRSRAFRIRAAAHGVAPEA